MTFGEEWSAYLAEHPYQELTAGGAKFRYILDGAPDKRAIVFLNGLNMQEAWLRYMKAFSRDYCVLMMEYPITPRTNNELLDAIDALLEALDIHKPVIIGGSDGGALAQLYLRRFPQNISALILMTTVTIDSQYCENTRKELPLLPFIKGMFRIIPFSMMKKRLIGQVTGYFNDESEAEQAYGRSFFEQIASDPYYKKKFIHAMGLVGDLSVQEKMKPEEFLLVEGKILVLQPDKDIFTKEDQERLRSLIPHAEHHTMRGGHLSFVVCAEDYIALIERFLKNALTEEVQ